MTMTPFQREGLTLLGYSPRESEFLYLVATHSGYFTLRQFKAFLGSDSGSVAHTFAQKLLDRRHATYRAFRSGERVYHLFARRVYQAMEREHLRTRKKHELEYVKTRLIALDFVLANPQFEYLETEAEKLTFFTGHCGIAKEALPVKLYRARKGAEVTPRYFVDRFPIMVDRAVTPPVVTFTYVDFGSVTLNGFETHLRSYQPLLQRLGTFEFLFISPTGRAFQAAQGTFERTLQTAGKPTGSGVLRDYFRLRKAWDVKERVASADVVKLKKYEDQFRGLVSNQIYERWRAGSIADDELSGLFRSPQTMPKVSYRSMLCGHSLTVFAPSNRQFSQQSTSSEPPQEACENAQGARSAIFPVLRPAFRCPQVVNPSTATEYPATEPTGGTEEKTVFGR